LNAAVEREEIHHRAIDMRFYSRADGLYEVEGRLLDTKTHAFRRVLADEDMAPGAPLHDISVRVVIDDAYLVHDVQALMRATPFDICPGAEQTLSSLKGLTMGAGWNRKVRELLGGAASCTHIVELLGPMATTAYQGLSPQRLARMNDPAQEAQREKKVNSCFAYAAGREVVAQLWPDLHVPGASRQPL
jgi:hypothetical protein